MSRNITFLIFVTVGIRTQDGRDKPGHREHSNRSEVDRVIELLISYHFVPNSNFHLHL